MKKVITERQIISFKRYLIEEEKSKNTVDKYMRDVRTFWAYRRGCGVDRGAVLAYKEHLGAHYSVAGANSMLAALNCFFRFCGWGDFCVKQFKVQKNAFCSEAKELSQEEYKRLICAAEMKKNERLSLVLQTVCGMGIRVSELRYVTVEAVERGEITVSCKSKTRTLFLVPALRKKLMRYAKAHGIHSGTIFVTRTGKPLDRCNIWREMKGLCAAAGVSSEKVFPHNLRHLFARAFYSVEKDIAKLADVLGHSSINTTRIYIITTGAEHRRIMENMRLII